MMDHSGRLHALRSRGLISAVVTAAILLSACGGAALPSAADSATTTPRTPTTMCLDGFHAGVRSSIKVNRALIVPLHRVKKWVLSREPDIRWQTFSSSLSHAPTMERVGVCVLSRKDGKKLKVAVGVRPAESVLAIVRPNGDVTIFELGTIASNLAHMPSGAGKGTEP